MRARCTGCNHAIEFTHAKGKKLSDSKCACGGEYQMMRKHEVLGEAPLAGFTHSLFGKVYHMVYKNGTGEYLYDRGRSVFVKIEKVAA